MGYRLLLDENIEHEVMHRLEKYGHDVEHVDFVPALGKGIDDRSIGQYSLDEERIIITHDTDFVDTIDSVDYHVAIFFEDMTLSARQVADIVHIMSEYVPQSQLNGLEFGNTDWLDVD
jgi:hypothetical protein